MVFFSLARLEITDWPSRRTRNQFIAGDDPDPAGPPARPGLNPGTLVSQRGLGSQRNRTNSQSEVRSASPPPDDAERTNEARIVQSHSHVVIRTSESFLVRGGIAVIATELPRSLLYWTGRWLSGDSRAAKNVSVGANEVALARCCA